VCELHDLSCPSPSHVLLHLCSFPVMAKGLQFCRYLRMGVRRVRLALKYAHTSGPYNEGLEMSYLNALGYLCLTVVIIVLAIDDFQRRSIQAGPDAAGIFDAGYTTGVHDTVERTACPPGPKGLPGSHKWEQRPHA